MNFPDDLLEKGLPLVGPIIVLPPWIWMAVRTQQLLGVITAHTIPFQKRTIWLVKTLALIVGVGGLFGAVVQVGMTWLVAVLPGAIVLFLALKETVREIVPPKPSQDAAAYQKSWETYHTVRRDFVRSWKWFGASFLMVFFTAVFADRMTKPIQISLFALCIVAALFSIVIMNIKQLKWLRWPCPRCGCSFRGFRGRLWLPKKCVYCGLPRDLERH